MTRKEILFDVAKRCGIDIDDNEDVMVYDRDKMAKFKKWLFEELKNAGQDPCEDAVSRQAVLAIARDSCLDLDSYEDTKEFCDEIKELPPVAIAKLPLNATNGDMFMTMFPGAKVVNEKKYTWKYSYVVEVKLPYHTEYDTGLFFSISWWNAPCKAGEQLKDGLAYAE